MSSRNYKKKNAMEQPSLNTFYSENSSRHVNGFGQRDADNFNRERVMEYIRGSQQSLGVPVEEHGSRRRHKEKSRSKKEHDDKGSGKLSQESSNQKQRDCTSRGSNTNTRGLHHFGCLEDNNSKTSSTLWNIRSLNDGPPEVPLLHSKSSNDLPRINQAKQESEKSGASCRDTKLLEPGIDRHLLKDSGANNGDAYSCKSSNHTAACSFRTTNSHSSRLSDDLQRLVMLQIEQARLQRHISGKCKKLIKATEILEEKEKSKKPQTVTKVAENPPPVKNIGEVLEVSAHEFIINKAIRPVINEVHKMCLRSVTQELRVLNEIEELPKKIHDAIHAYNKTLE